HPQQIFVVRGNGADLLQTSVVEQSELGGQSHRQLDPHRSHRMAGAEVVRAEPVIEDKAGLTVRRGGLFRFPHVAHTSRWSLAGCRYTTCVRLSGLRWWPAV